MRLVCGKFIRYSHAVSEPECTVRQRKRTRVLVKCVTWIGIGDSHRRAALFSHAAGVVIQLAGNVPSVQSYRIQPLSPCHDELTVRRIRLVERERLQPDRQCADLALHVSLYNWVPRGMSRLRYHVECERHSRAPLGQRPGRRQLLRQLHGHRLHDARRRVRRRRLQVGPVRKRRSTVAPALSTIA